MEDKDNLLSRSPEEFAFENGIKNEETLKIAQKKLREIYDSLILGHTHYLDWSLNEIKLQSIWDIGTYFYKSFPSFPYRFVTAMKGSGKTRLLKMTLAVCKNGRLVNQLTDSSLFRSAENSTLLFDEAENISSKEKKNQRLILNSGYKKGAVITILKEVKNLNGMKDYITQDYPVYSPKMLCNISGMEEVLGDRCISSILEKSNNPSKTKLVEDFDTNPFFLNIKRTLHQVSVVWCSEQEGKNAHKWNTYISKKYTDTHYTLTTLNYTNIHLDILSKEDIELFDLIDKADLNGRDLELFFPLFFVADWIGRDVLLDLIDIAKEKVIEKKENEFMGSKDIALFDFVSKQIESRPYETISQLATEFRMFFEHDEEGLQWLNSHWMGKALMRLKLIKEKRRVSRGMEVILDVKKAKEKIKIFKSDDINHLTKGDGGDQK